MRYKENYNPEAGFMVPRDENGVFITPIVLTLTAIQGSFNSAGFTFIFSMSKAFFISCNLLSK